MGKLKACIERIMPILASEKRTRDDDMLLIYRVWKDELDHMGAVPAIYNLSIVANEHTFLKLTNPETIIRARAFIQNDKTMRKYPPSPDTKRGRDWLEKCTVEELREMKRKEDGRLW